MLKVFLSHSVTADDYSLVISIANVMWQGGAIVFVAEWVPRYPKDVRKVNKTTAIQIDTSDVVLGIATAKSRRGAWMQHELEYATTKGKRVVFLAEEGANTEPLQVALGQLPVTRFSRGGYAATARGVLDALDHEQVNGNTQGFTSLLLLGLGFWTLSEMPRLKN